MTTKNQSDFPVCFVKPGGFMLLAKCNGFWNMEDSIIATNLQRIQFNRSWWNTIIQIKLTKPHEEGKRKREEREKQGEDGSQQEVCTYASMQEGETYDEIDNLNDN